MSKTPALADPDATGNVGQAIAAGLRIGELEAPRMIDVEGVPHLVTPADISVKECSELLPRPLALKEARAFYEVESFARYVNQFRDDDTRIYVTHETPNILELCAVFDDHEGVRHEDDNEAPAVNNARPRWKRHRAFLKLEPSAELRVWMMRADERMDQLAFAQFLQEQIPFIAEPAADMLQRAVTVFSTVESDDIESVVAPGGGEYAVNTKSGVVSTGPVKLPELVVLMLRPYPRADAIPFSARVRWSFSKRDKTLSFWYALMGFNIHTRNPLPLDTTFEGVADDVRREVADRTGLVPLA